VTTHHCCGVGRAESARPTLRGRCLEAAGWAGPGIVLALLPKCPMCLAAYLAVGTGIGLSASTAGYVQYGLVAGCVGSIAVLAARRIRRIAGVLFPRRTA
jgi:hypothetical protein